MDYAEHVRLASRLLQNEWARGNTGAVVDHLMNLSKVDSSVVLLNISAEMTKTDQAKLIRLLIGRSDLLPGYRLEALAKQQRRIGAAATAHS